MFVHMLVMWLSYHYFKTVSNVLVALTCDGVSQIQSVNLWCGDINTLRIPMVQRPD